MRQFVRRGIPLKTQIKIEAIISAKIDKVWEYWNSPKHITGWNSASPDWHCPNAENDLKVGGKLKSRMEARDGSFGFDFEGTYTKVIPKQMISYVLADGRQVTTQFESSGPSTQITTVFDAETQNPVEMQKVGWQAILNSFKSYTESH